MIEPGLLWVCNVCELIGTRAQAERHSRLVGHAVLSCSPEETVMIREQWIDEGRDAVDGALIGGNPVPRRHLTLIPSFGRVTEGERDLSC